MINTDCRRNWYYPLAIPKTKPAEALDTSGIPIFDNVPGWLAPIVLETCVTHLLPSQFRFVKLLEPELTSYKKE
ncbi:MAG: hypothetical protein WBE68_10535 [Candidatus Nitrosopolaris sp.]